MNKQQESHTHSILVEKSKNLKQSPTMNLHSHFFNVVKSRAPQYYHQVWFDLAYVVDDEVGQPRGGLLDRVKSIIQQPNK